MNIRKLRGACVAIAALASTACAVTSEGLDMGHVNHSKQPAVVAVGQSKDVDADGERMFCQCMLRKSSSGMSGVDEDKCPVAHGTGIHATVPPVDVGGSASRP